MQFLNQMSFQGNALVQGVISGKILWKKFRMNRFLMFGWGYFPTISWNLSPDCP